MKTFIQRQLIRRQLIERQLYRPAFVLPLMGLTRLLVITDFSLTMTGFILLMRGSRSVLLFVLRVPQWVRRPMRWTRVAAGRQHPAESASICGKSQFGMCGGHGPL